MNKKMYLIFLFLLLVFALISCAKKIPQFNGIKAYQYLEKQCDFGTRNPNSEGHLLCKNYLINFLEEAGAEVKTQEFTHIIRGENYQLTNIIASFYPKRRNRLVFGAHWDTRPWADLDSIKANQNTPIMGANDAASGVAVLMELAEILSKNDPLTHGIDIVFFDGEDAGTAGTEENWCLGSAYFVENYEFNTEPQAVIIVDMIGDADLQVEIEGFSYKNSPELVTEIWKIAEGLNIKSFDTKLSNYIFDDHYPFLEKGYNAIDIIDFDYPYWHTLEDTPDKCSAESLQQIGDVLVKFIYSK
ncbi:MAG: M28 family peptidase [Candidatus Cloacimonadota bacterium]|nr:M28 family peptidase [Candidatus Cloacimonadota bacterium]